MYVRTTYLMRVHNVVRPYSDSSVPLAPYGPFLSDLLRGNVQVKRLNREDHTYASEGALFADR